MNNKYIFLAILFLLVISTFLQACSTFCLIDSEDIIFGRNYDWMVEEGIIIINKRNMEKTALIEKNPAHWISKYGSVTFNQYGREMPMDGINEAGLVVAQLWLEETEYSISDSRPSIGNLQWIQYQLDNYNSVEEVINSDSEIRIESTSSTIHYLICDKEGHCATIEFLNGEMVCHTEEDMPINVLTNNTYQSSVEFYNNNNSKYDNENNLVTYADSGDDLSLIAFCMIANKLKFYYPERVTSAIDYVFGILKKVKYGGFSKWSIVYDIDKMGIYYYTSSSENIKFINLKSIDFSCSNPVQILDINSDISGETTDSFIDYTTEINRAILDIVYSKTPFLKDTPSEVLEIIATYPESIRCLD